MILSLVKSGPVGKAQGLIDKAAPIGVLDIGSNSVRLVIYERHSRALTPLYNEKATCALGRGLNETGELSEKSVERTMVALRRFALVAELSRAKVHVLATAATREASNGASFIEAVEEIMGVKVEVLSGAEEAHYAAMGVVSGMPEHSGLVGDLGGGSLEIATVRDHHDISGETLALGAIRLQDDSGGDLDKAAELARERIAKAERLTQEAPDTRFVAIGGTWRALAKLHQMRSKYPLHLIQNYEISAEEITDLCKKIVEAAAKGNDVEGAEALSSSRRALLPYGAVVMLEVLKAGGFEKVSFSALGVREGYLFDLLPDAVKAEDPLIEACRELAILRARTPDHADDLDAFCGRFMRAAGLFESAADQRLRRAACLLSDIGWRGHPDYRGEQAVDMVAFGSFVGIDHPGRAFLAQALAVRYMGLKQQSISQAILDLCGEDAGKRARLLGAAMRVGFLLSAGREGVLSQVDWKIEDGKLLVVLPNALAFLAAEKMMRRLGQLASALDLKPDVIVAD